jgi:hypothetical protein
MNPWSTILNRIWYYLEQGPKSGPVAAAVPAANRYRYDKSEREPDPPTASNQTILCVDQSGGEIDLDYSPHYLLCKEDYQITLWSGNLVLDKANDLRLKILAAMESGLPDLGLENVLDVAIRSGRLCPSPDKIERDADGRLMEWRRDIKNTRQRSILLELNVRFLIDRDSL